MKSPQPPLSLSPPYPSIAISTVTKQKKEAAYETNDIKDDDGAFDAFDGTATHLARDYQSPSDSEDGEIKEEKEKKRKKKKKKEGKKVIWEWKAVRC